MAAGLSFSELSNALQIAKEPTKESEPPLCDNIFDVQRHDLYAVLCQLRTTFWSDPVKRRASRMPSLTVSMPQTVSIPQTADSPSAESPRKRAYDENELATPNTQKRMRLLSTPGQSGNAATASSQQRAPKSSTQRTQHLPRWHGDLSQRQHRLIRLIRNEKCDAARLARELREVPNGQEQRFLARYLIPVAQAMRRQALVDALFNYEVKQVL